MRLRTPRRAIYAAMGLTVLALIGGFTLASLSLGGSSSSSHQGSQTTNVTPIPGLTWTETVLNVTPSAVTNTTDCSTMSGCNISSQSAVVCAGSVDAGTWCNAGDFVEEMILTTTAGTSMGGIAGLTLFVVTSAHTYEGETFYFSDSNSNTAQTITIEFDIGTPASGPAAVQTVTVVGSV